MLKTVLFTSAMIVAVPAMAQTTPATPATPAAQAQTSAPATPQAVPAQAQPSQAAPAQPAPADQTAAATAQPASGDQVAQVVNSEFATYDKNADGKLSKTEFAAWMTALKSADPSAKKDAASDKKWNDAAFAQADTDKSKSVTKEELTAFLSKGQNAS